MGDSRTTMRIQKLVELSEKLAEFEIVPGLRLSAPEFESLWSSQDIAAVRSMVQIPPSFQELVCNHGGISAMDIAGGVAFLSATDIQDHLSQDYHHLLESVGESSTFPFAVNGSGSYLLLATDDTAVWKFNAHMHPIAKPVKISTSLHSFLDALVDDWEAMLAGKGAPYSTS
jgi:hypothetical protein